MFAAELPIDLTIVGIVTLCIGVVAATVWWSAYCQKRFRRQ